MLEHCLVAGMGLLLCELIIWSILKQPFELFKSVLDIHLKTTLS